MTPTTSYSFLLSRVTEEAGRPLTLAEFSLEHSIRTDEFLLDDPFTGPEVTTAEKISKVIEMTADVILAMAEQQRVLNEEQACEIADIKTLPPSTTRPRVPTSYASPSKREGSSSTTAACGTSANTADTTAPVPRRAPVFACHACATN